MVEPKELEYGITLNWFHNSKEDSTINSQHAYM